MADVTFIVRSASAGHQDIKKAIACLLFCGSRKCLPDGMRLRGDINVLLLVWTRLYPSS
jgi:DNA replication licensing factor MCM5